MQNLTQTGAAVYYLPFGDNDDEERHEALTTLRHRISYDDDYTLTQEDFDAHYEFKGTDPQASLKNIFPRWNAGSGQESEAFAMRECEDCDAVFTGRRDFSDHGERPAGESPENPVSLRVRQQQARIHEADTDHTVGHGRRSLSAGDVVVIDGTVHLVARFGFEELDRIEVTR